jgi:hypothetical protein
MNDIRYVLVTVQGAPVYTNGHKYSLRKGAGKWRVHAWDFYAREKLGSLVERHIGQSVRWEPFTGAPATLYNHTFGPVACPGCSARDSVIHELLDALRLGWIDLKSNKFKRLERIALEATK